MLDEYTLLSVFYALRLDLADSGDDVVIETDWGLGTNWGRIRWWYKPAQVCRRWRMIILESPVRLDLHLVCTYGTPVADILVHSPPLPLVIDYLDVDRERTAEDDDGILLALSTLRSCTSYRPCGPSHEFVAASRGLGQMFPDSRTPVHQFRDEKIDEPNGSRDISSAFFTQPSAFLCSPSNRISITVGLRGPCYSRA